jgi:hypothetical protein
MQIIHDDHIYQLRKQPHFVAGDLPVFSSPGCRRSKASYLIPPCD